MEKAQNRELDLVESPPGILRGGFHLLFALIWLLMLRYRPMFKTRGFASEARLIFALKIKMKPAVSGSGAAW
jgi:hypothetical protein